MVNPRRNAQKGFTLIELLIVVTIVGLLAGIAMVNVRNAQKRAAENVLKAQLAQLRKAIDDFYADKQRYPASLQELVDEHYMRKLPADPITKSTETWIEVKEDETDTGSSSFSSSTFDSSTPEGPQGPGITDVKSGAEGETLEHVPYGDL